MKNQDKKRIHPTEKSVLHPRNKHRNRYDFQTLIKACSELSAFVYLNAWGDESIVFSDPLAVKILNKALLKAYYGIQNWDIPQGYLCPPIPGRADYLHYAADLLASSNQGVIPQGKQMHVLDIGTGANVIYPLIGSVVYGWSFTGCDTDAQALRSAKTILDANPDLLPLIDLRLQKNSKHIFTGIIQNEDRFDLTVCNPPFHASASEALAGSERKNRNLKINTENKMLLNFGGQENELWTPGGELRFVKTMAQESKLFSNHCLWFTCLVSKQSNLKAIQDTLMGYGVKKYTTIPMGQGNKTSRIVAWTFLDEFNQKQWFKDKARI